jgi:short-chain 2-methylacyl-CoA dehydrogenase
MNSPYATNPDIHDLREMVRNVAEKRIAPFADEWSRDGEVPASLWNTLGDLGLMGMLIPEEYGGAAAGFLTYVAVMEELGRADQSVAAAWNAHSTIGVLPLVQYGTHEQKERWLRPLAEGRALAAFGLTEPGAGSDAGAVRTRARRIDGGWSITGTKMFISNPGTSISQGVTLLARTGDGDARDYGVFYVPTGTPGYTQGRPLEKLGWKAMDTRELTFEECVVPEDHLIGAEGAGLRQFLDVLDGGRISVAALSLSLAQRALELAVEHARAREQFGKTLSSFQAVQHHIATMATEVEAARGLVYRAAWLADNGHSFSREAAMAKLYASEVANRAASTSLQVHGGYRYILESEISRFYRDAKILEIGEGSNEIQRNLIAKDVFARGVGA